MMAFLPQLRGQSGEAMAVRPGLQPGQLHEKADFAKVSETLVTAEAVQVTQHSRHSYLSPL
jgi:hypothetical protein